MLGTEAIVALAILLGWIVLVYYLGIRMLTQFNSNS